MFLDKKNVENKDFSVDNYKIKGLHIYSGIPASFQGFSIFLLEYMLL